MVREIRALAVLWFLLCFSVPLVVCAESSSTCLMVNKEAQDFQSPKCALDVSQQYFKEEEFPSLDPREEVIQAWYMDDSDEDQRLPHIREPKEYVSLDQLADIGVLSWRLNADIYETDEELKKIRNARGYSYMDICEVCPEKLPNYKEKIKSFFEEHLHTDEEIRYCLAGSGYFDFRDRNESWIRVWVKKGGLIVLPARIYHRFTLDTDNYIKAMRFFAGGPVWTAYNRPHDDLPARKEYVKVFIKKEIANNAVNSAA